MRAYLIVECYDGLSESVKILLAELRKRGRLAPYSEGWCIKEGFMPWSLRKNDKES